MIKYALKGVMDGQIVYYAGGRYDPAPSAFSRNLYQATLFMVREDIDTMKYTLDNRFQVAFIIVMVRVTLQEVVQKGS